MKTYADIKSQIAKLEKQAEKARKTEIAGVVGRIKQAIAAYGLTAQDLGFGGAKSAGARAAGKSPAVKVGATVGVAKYRDPESGKTWTGRGKPPNWIVGAKDRTAFLIDGESSAAPRTRGPGRKAAKATRGSGKRAAKAAAKAPAPQVESAAAQ
jgi:DNA-binding protein H-NS